MDHFFQPSQRIFLNLNNPLGLMEAARRVAIDKQVIALNFSTFGLMGSAATVAETMKISLPKGHTQLKPHTLLLNKIDDIIPVIDLARIHPKLHPIIKHPKQFHQRIAHVTHVRIPVHKNALVNGVKLHAGVTSYENDNPDLPLAQFLMFTGIPQDFISQAYRLGLKLGAVTSMNYKTNPTIINVKDALKFVEKSQVSTFIYQPNIKVQPSYSGISINLKGVSLVREGHTPTTTIAKIWHDVPFSQTG